MTTASTSMALILAAATLAPPAAAGQGAAARAPLPVSPDRIDLRLEVRSELPVVEVEADLTFQANENLETVELFMGPNLTLEAVAGEDGAPLDYQRRRDRVRIATPPLAAGDTVTWRFRYQLRFPASLREAGQMFTALPWYPHFRHPPNAFEYTRYVPMRTRLTATLPRPWVLIAPGAGTTRNDDRNITYTWTDSVPAPATALVIGNLEQQSRTHSSRIFRSFFPPGARSVSRPYAEYFAVAVTYFADNIGNLPRRNFSLVALQLPEGISGLTVAGVTFLQAGEIRPEQPFPYRILAHEIAHYWWNYHTEIPRRSDGWLREGLPTYSALLFLEHEYGHAMMRQELERSRRVSLAVSSDEPLALGFGMATTEAIYAFNYHKAALVLHMLRQVIGSDGFAQLLRRLHELPAALTRGAFVAEAERIYGDDLSWFFASWLDSAAIPSFTVRYDSGVHEDESLSLFQLRGVIEQHGAAIRHPVLLRIPLDGAPPLEQRVWIEAGTTEFAITLPSRARGLEFDPRGDLLYRSVTVEERAPR
jgi:hypothetical protein